MTSLRTRSRDRATRSATAPRAVAALRLTAVLASGLLAGAVLVIWLLDVELGRTAALFTAYRQAATGPLTGSLPPLGGVALVAAAACAVLGRGRDRVVALSAASCLLVGLIVTVMVHFPINAEILTWSAAAPPADWQQLRDRWQAAHAARSLLSAAAFVLLALGPAGGAGRAAPAP